MTKDADQEDYQAPSTLWDKRTETSAAIRGTRGRKTQKYRQRRDGGCDKKKKKRKNSRKPLGESPTRKTAERTKGGKGQLGEQIKTHTKN